MTVATGCGIHSEYKTSALGFWFTQTGKKKEKMKNQQHLIFIWVFTGEGLGVGNLRPVAVEQSITF